MENKMTYLKRAALALLFSLMIACGGTKNDELDYTQITDAEMMQMADTKMEAGNYEAAIADYNKLLLDFPTSNLHIDAQIKIAEAYGRLDKFEDQMNQLHRLVKENIIPNRVPRIYVQLGKFYERAAIFNPGISSTDSADYRDAISYYDQALKYPDSDDTKSKSEAVYRRALVEAKIGQIEEAIARYRLVSSLFPNSDFSILSQIKLKDPANTSELATTDSALTVYRETLGLAEVQEEEAVEVNEETPGESIESQDESNLESIMEPVQEETANEMEEDAPSEEQNDTVNEEPSTDDLFTPAVEDSSDNR
jgi:tetratricopeptide (TPR) repeat protein